MHIQLINYISIHIIIYNYRPLAPFSPAFLTYWALWDSIYQSGLAVQRIDPIWIRLGPKYGFSLDSIYQSGLDWARSGSPLGGMHGIPVGIKEHVFRSSGLLGMPPAEVNLWTCASTPRGHWMKSCDVFLIVCLKLQKPYLFLGKSSNCLQSASIFKMTYFFEKRKHRFAEI